jgi:hypothetical protein
MCVSVPEKGWKAQAETTTKSAETTIVAAIMASIVPPSAKKRLEAVRAMSLKMIASPLGVGDRNAAARPDVQADAHRLVPD